MKIWLAIVLIVVVAVISGVAFFFLGIAHRKRHAEAVIGSAQQEANRIVAKAVSEGEQQKKEIIVEGKEEVAKLKLDVEAEAKQQRIEYKRQENRLNQKEDNLDKKTDQLEKKQEQLTKKLNEAQQKNEEIDKIKEQQLEKLQEISGYTQQQAKQIVLDRFDAELSHEKAVKLLDYEQQFKEESDEKAKEILMLAIQRMAAETTADVTVSVVDLPNDEMKGRIIGREGRNIRALEQITGVDLIIDDTPETITVSSFDPVKREVARLTLEKLITDGRIHPAKIEETFEKAKKEVNATIRQTGERAVIEVGVNGLNIELVKLLGKLKYRTSYGQNMLSHSMEVAYLCGLMASELGVDVKTAKRAGLLHDIGKALDHEFEGTHVELGVEVAKKYKENATIVHAIASHHGDTQAQTIYDVLVQAADAISAARPGARRDNVQNYIKRLEKLEEIATSFEGVDKSYAIQAGREIRIMVKPEVVSDDQMIVIARDICKKIESELEYPGQIKVNIIREARAVEYAK